jgi:hypothetical protein
MPAFAGMTAKELVQSFLRESFWIFFGSRNGLLESLAHFH